MTIRKLYVCDTCCLISYFDSIFEPLGAAIALSVSARALLDDVIKNIHSNIRISIPSVVFFEIYAKWLTTEEVTKMFYYQAYQKLLSCPNIEIKAIEKDVLLHLTSIGHELSDHEIFDKIVVASALELDCPLMTTDTKIIEYQKNQKRIVGILN